MATGGKAGKPPKELDSQAPMPAPSGIALSVAESRRSEAVGALERSLAVIDRTPLFSASGQPMPEHMRRQRTEARQDIEAKIERLRGLSGYDLASEFASEYLTRTQPQEEPVRLEETLLRGNYGPRAVNGAPVVVADPTYMARYRERMAEQAEQAEHEDRVKRGQEALALAALTGQEN
jgi:hypothetical protein